MKRVLIALLFAATAWGTSYVYDTGPTPGTKIQTRPSINPVQEVSATEFNQVTTALKDLRSAIKDQAVYSVKFYGAKGDGVTDDTDAIQACFDAVSAASLAGIRAAGFFPDGKYIISKPLLIPYPGAVTLYGNNKGSAIIEAKNTFSGYDLIIGPNYQTIGQGPFALGSLDGGSFGYVYNEDHVNSNDVDLGQVTEGRLPDNHDWTVNFKFKPSAPLTSITKIWGTAGTLWSGQHKDAAGFIYNSGASSTLQASFRYNGYWYDLFPAFSPVQTIAVGTEAEYEMDWDNAAHTLRVFLNGKLWTLGAWSPPGTGGAGVLDSYGFVQYPWETISLGMGENTSIADGISNGHQNGTMREYHVSNSVRHTAAYTPTGVTPVPDGNTRLYLDFTTFYRGMLIAKGFNSLVTIYLYPYVSSPLESPQNVIKNLTFNFGSGLYCNFCSSSVFDTIYLYTPADGFRHAKQGYFSTFKTVKVEQAGRIGLFTGGSYMDMSDIDVSGAVPFVSSGANIFVHTLKTTINANAYMGSYFAGGSADIVGYATDAEVNTTPRWISNIVVSGMQQLHFKTATIYNPPNHQVSEPVIRVNNATDNERISIDGAYMSFPPSAAPVIQNVKEASSTGTINWSQPMTVRNLYFERPPAPLTDNPVNVVNESDLFDLHHPRTCVNGGPPDSGTWPIGAICDNTVPIPGGYMGFVCTDAGAGSACGWKGYGAIAP